LRLQETTEANAAMFRVHDEQLKLEQLELLLRPVHREQRSQAIAVVTGVGQCLLTNCVVTLDDERPDGVPLDVLGLADPTEVKRMDRPPPGRKMPLFRLEGCFIHGKGDLLEARASLPFELDVRNSLIVLDGSLLSVEGKTDEAATAQPSAQIAIQRVTAYFTKHFLDLRVVRTDDNKIGKGLVATQINGASHCVFASAARDAKAFVHIDGLEDISNDQLRRLLVWTGDNNLYSNFDAMVDYQPRGENAPSERLDKRAWKDFFDPQETEARFDKIKFHPAVKFAGTTPPQFRLRIDPPLAGLGVDIDKLLEGLPKHTASRDADAGEPSENFPERR
jgi:hypothetical protein